MASVNQTRLHSVNQMGKTHSKPLAAQHGRGTACYVWIGLKTAFWIKALQAFAVTTPKHCNSALLHDKHNSSRRDAQYDILIATPLSSFVYSCTSVTNHNSSDTLSRYTHSNFLIKVKNRNVRTILFKYPRIMMKVWVGAEAVLHAFLSLHHMKLRG